MTSADVEADDISHVCSSRLTELVVEPTTRAFAMAADFMVLAVTCHYTHGQYRHLMEIGRRLSLPMLFLRDGEHLRMLKACSSSSKIVSGFVYFLYVVYKHA